jgi:hypothetical protein
MPCKYFSGKQIMLKRQREEATLNKKPSNSEEKCCFCGEDATVVMDGNFPKAYCFLHYYTSRACRKNNGKLIKTSRVRSMTDDPNCPIQNLFADAFISLQREIKEAAARFDPKDPLSFLDESKTSFPRPSKTKDAHPKKSLHGGFMPEISAAEKKLMEQHMRSSVMTEIPNPYKRKKFPTSTIWHKAMDLSNTESQTIDSYPMEDVCSCGSNNVIYNGHTARRSEESTKAEIWGTKQDSDLTCRCRCLNCGRAWD